MTVNFTKMFEEFGAAKTSDKPEVRNYRKLSYENFLKLGIPSRKSEEWKYTNLKFLGDIEWKRCPLNKKISSIELPQLPQDSYQMVFLDGVFQADEREFQNV